MDEHGVVQDDVKTAERLGRMTALICLGYGYYNKKDILPPGPYVHSRMNDLMTRPQSFPAHYKKFLVHCGGLTENKKHLTSKVLMERMNRLMAESRGMFPKRLSLVEKGTFLYGFSTQFEETALEIRGEIQKAYERKEKARKEQGESLVKTGEELLIA